MNFQALSNHLIDVTNEAVHSYIGFIQSNYMTEPVGSTIDSLVVYNLLKQSHPIDQIDDTNSDPEEFGLLDDDELIDLVKNTFINNFHIYEVNNDLINALDEYNQNFGLDYRKHLSWSTRQNRLDDQNPNYQNQHLYIVADGKNEPSFKQSLNENIFGGLTNNSKAIDLFLNHN